MLLSPVKVLGDKRPPGQLIRRVTSQTFVILGIDLEFLKNAAELTIEANLMWWLIKDRNPKFQNLVNLEICISKILLSALLNIGVLLNLVIKEFVKSSGVG